VSECKAYPELTRKSINFAIILVPDAYVVDTGVFLRWFVDQPGFEHARRVQREFVDGEILLETVDFARIEVAEVLRKKGYLAGLLDRDEFEAATQIIDDLEVEVHPTDPARLQRAVALTTRQPLRMFDALFVQVALDRELPLLTADRKLCRAVSSVAATELLHGVDPDGDLHPNAAE
jgi:predicted nucleic acid-binding protein